MRQLTDQASKRLGRIRRVKHNALLSSHEQEGVFGIAVRYPVTGSSVGVCDVRTRVGTIGLQSKVCDELATSCVDSVADRYAQYPSRWRTMPHAQQQSRVGRARAECDDNGVWHGSTLHLRGDLKSAFSERTDALGGGTAEGNHERVSPFPTQFVRQSEHHPIRIRMGRRSREMAPCAKERVEEEIPNEWLTLLTPQDQVALKAAPDGRGCRQPAVIGLNPTRGDHRVVSARSDHGHNLLQLANLVPTQAQRRKILAFEVQVDTEYARERVSSV